MHTTTAQPMFLAMRTLAFAIALCISVWPLRIVAETVTPSERVREFVSVRKSPSVSSRTIGKLSVGEDADLVESVPNWYRVRTDDGTVGYVHKAWTTLRAAGQGQPFAVHFVDVGTGDAAIIDVGDREIVIDGGDSRSVLQDYVDRTGIIQNPIELKVVTHGDTDHWNGLVRLLGFDGAATNPKTALEFWEPGYDRDCKPLESYDAFIQDVRQIRGVKFRRPLEDFHHPADVTGHAEPFQLQSVPGVTITVLHTDAHPTASDCAYQINNASIVLLIEIAGVRFLFPGDANGKERDEPSPGTPGHVEAKLLALEAAHPGTLRADVLKVPHHGSQTASTQKFIDAVNPAFAIISASTKHHLPKPTVVRRYENGQRVILRTDVDRRSDRDHIVCTKTERAELNCNYADILDE